MPQIIKNSKQLLCIRQQLIVSQDCKNRRMKQNKPLVNIRPSSCNKAVPRYSDKYKDVLERAYKREQSLKQKTKPIFFYRVRSIGVGAFSFVYLVAEQNTGSIFAQKSINKKSIAPELITQIKMHLCLHHENIVNLYHVYAQDNYVHLVMDYAGQSLFSLRKNNKIPQTLNQQQTIQILKQLISAVRYLHGKRIVHADIKLQNILYFQNVIKLCDLGYAHIAAPEHCPLQSNNNSSSNTHEYGSHYDHKYDDNKYKHEHSYEYPDQHTQIKMKEVVGTLEYLDPEYVQGKHSQFSRDIWAIGIVAYELLVGKNPFQHMAEGEKWSTMLRVIVNLTQIKQIEVKNLSVSKQMEQLLSMTLCPIAHRADITKIQSLPVFNKIESSTKKLWLDRFDNNLFS